jgi:hypothetical protein
MPEIPCKYVKHTAEGEFLRIYWGTTLNLPVGTHGGWSYHDAKKRINVLPLDKVAGIAIHEVNDDEFKELSEKYQWPTKCDYCSDNPPPRGTEGVNYHLFYESLYEEPPRPLEPGDIYATPWRHDSPDSYGVKLPNGSDWYTYLRASNCTHSDMIEVKDGITYYKQHKCWTTTGEPPNLDVNPSILSEQGLPGEWHGYLKNGKLVW